ncbi:MAG: hypothetical protein Q7T70_02505 [Polaromonas sp.]|nr:hypothetical protein [Polaromonas sp.]
MKYLETSGGRALSVRIEGAAGTVKDYMVAAHVYLTTLEHQFRTTGRLIAAYRASRRELEAGRSMLTLQELDLTSQWLNAHEAADRAARTFLSSPQVQRFILSPVVEDIQGSGSKPPFLKAKADKNALAPMKKSPRPKAGG